MSATDLRRLGRPAGPRSRLGERAPTPRTSVAPRRGGPPARARPFARAPRDRRLRRPVRRRARSPAGCRTGRSRVHRSRQIDLRAQGATWEEPIGLDYRDVAGDESSHRTARASSRSRSSASSLASSSPPASVRPGRRRRSPLDPPRPRGVEAGDGRPRRAPGRSGEVAADATNRLLSDDHLADLASRIDAERAAPAPPALVPRGGGTIYLAVVDGQGNAVSLIQSNYKGFGSGVLDPETGIHYHDRGLVLHAAGRTPQRARARQAAAPHAPAGDAVPGRPTVGRGRARWAATPSPRSTPRSCRRSSTGLDVATAVAAPRWFVEPEEHFAPPVEVRLENRVSPGIARALRDLGHPVTDLDGFDSVVGHCHAIELIAGGPATDGSLAAATGPAARDYRQSGRARRSHRVSDRAARRGYILRWPMRPAHRVVSSCRDPGGP